MLGVFFYHHGPLTRYVKLRVAHALGIPLTFCPPRISKEIASSRSRHASRHMRRACALCISESLTRGGGENVPGIPGACATRNFRCLVRGSCCWIYVRKHENAYLHFQSFLNSKLTPIFQNIRRISIGNVYIANTNGMVKGQSEHPFVILRKWMLLRAHSWHFTEILTLQTHIHI